MFPYTVIDSDGSDEDIFALASDVQAKVTNFTDDDDDNFFIPDSQNNNDRDDNSPIPGLDTLSRSPGSPVFDRCASPVSPVTEARASPVSPLVEGLGSISSQGLQQKEQKITTRNNGKRKTGKCYKANKP